MRSEGEGGPRFGYALVLEYEGTRYAGFQVQPHLPTIQGEVEKALQSLTGERVRVTGASRTDAGVHARGQVVSFSTTRELEPETLVRGLNYYLPEDIAVQRALRVEPTFNARRSARSREYRYIILNRPTPSPLWRNWAYQFQRSLNAEAMDEACQALIGEHDFAPFTGSSEPVNTVRNVYRAGVQRRGELILFDIEANAFLPQQIRATAGALVNVGRDKITASAFRELAQRKERGLARPVLPPHGLYLMKVNYENLETGCDRE